MSLRVIFYRNDRPREHRISKCFAEGVMAHGDECEVRFKGHYGKGRRYEGPDGDADLTVAYGVKSRDILREHHNAGCNWGILDKGYIRRNGKWGVEKWTRISINETYPLHFLETKPMRPADRWKQTEIELKPLRAVKDEGHILVAGSSQKFYSYFGCRDEGRLHTKIIKRLRSRTDRPIVFRPKPSYEKRTRKSEDEQGLAAYGADGISLPNETIQRALRGAHCLVTFASNAACDAIFNGIPALTFGPHVSTPLTEHDFKNIDAPFIANNEIRQQWVQDLAYEQWTLEEMSSGEAWSHLRPRVLAGPYDDQWWELKHAGARWWEDE